MKKTTWVKPRHKAWRNLLNFILTPVIKSKYGFTPTPYKDATGEERQYLILLNHQTAFDQFFVGKSFKNHVYFVASEDLFSMGFISKIIVHATAPIPIKKQTTDVRSTLNVLKVIKEGGTIAIAPEGNRTFSGKTEYIKPSIVKLIRLAKLPLLFYKIEGGYGVMPRWADKTRKGYIKAKNNFVEFIKVK